MEPQLKDARESPPHTNLNTQLHTTVESIDTVDGLLPLALANNPARTPELDGDAIFHGNLIIGKIH